MFTDNITKVDSEPPNGSSDDITNPYECDQTLNVSAWLIPNLVPAAPYVPPTNKDLEILFQPMFDESFKPPSVERLVPPAPAVPVPVVSAGVAARPTFKDNPFAQVDNDPFVNPFAPEPSSEASSSGGVSTTKANH
ncbi:hypothetical protein Tco_1527562, partial [Tanacetum coccineum]